jgi:hypothetical protein
MKNILVFHIAGVMLLSSLTGCKKSETSTPVTNPTTVNLNFAVDNNTLKFDTLKYYNAAGNNYSVSGLTFYLSTFEFENAAGTVYRYSDVYLVDAKTKSNVSFSFADLPAGNYKRMKFLIGLDSLHNLDGALPNTVENANMVWPTYMGGGYHFMKLEGNFRDQGQTYGYAMHMGHNWTCVTVNLVKDFTLSAESAQVGLTMNINEWFQNPQVYDFNVDGNYSMTDSLAMTKLSQNGVDVFTLN